MGVKLGDIAGLMLDKEKIDKNLVYFNGADRQEGYNQAIDDQSQRVVAVDIEKLAGLINNSRLYDDAWKYNELCDDTVNILVKNRYDLANAISENLHQILIAEKDGVK